VLERGFEEKGQKSLDRTSTNTTNSDATTKKTSRTDATWKQPADVQRPPES
jgi:hypothetical protein